MSNIHLNQKKKRKKKKGGGNVKRATFRRKGKKKKKWKEQCMEKTYVKVHKDIFVHYAAPFSPFSFLSILERKFFGGPKEKTPRHHHLFSFLPSLYPTNHIPK